MDSIDVIQKALIVAVEPLLKDAPQRHLLAVFHRVVGAPRRGVLEFPLRVGCVFGGVLLDPVPLNRITGVIVEEHTPIQCAPGAVHDHPALALAGSVLVADDGRPVRKPSIFASTSAVGLSHSGGIAIFRSVPGRRPTRTSVNPDDAVA